ncbi:MAG: hypothetical protein ACE5F1_02595 [Planctomycetota bacterium]
MRCAALALVALLASPRVEAQELASFEQIESTGPASPRSGRLLVIVEEGLRARGGAELGERLGRFLGDLAGEGYRAVLFAAKLYRGQRHQDGRIVLALRRFLRECHASRAGLRGAILVGHFPDALLVRTVNWRKRGTPLKKYTKPMPYLRRVPEIVALRCDLVLADLDGEWESRYCEERSRIPELYALFPGGVPTKGGTCLDLRSGTLGFEDYFHVADGRVRVDAASKHVEIDDAPRDFECSAGDKERSNVIARPEIAISRIDARGVAWSPRPKLGTRPLLDSSGRPGSVALDENEKLDPVRDLWRPDPELELRLLLEYFDRNHRYRTTERGAAFRPASISWGLPSGFGVVKRAAGEWRDFSEPGYDVTKQSDLVALIDWFRRPAVLRTLRAHSDARGTAWARTGEQELHAALGGPPLSWSVKDGRLVPSLAAAGRRGRADFFLYRTLWENRTLPDHPNLMIHTGCHALSPPGAEKLRYEQPGYGARQNAESLLFLTPALAIVARSKVFYDEPRGFCAALREGKSFGAAWMRYFEIESRARTWKEAGGDIGRKRSYFWSVIGDWTLRLRYGRR